MSFSKSMAMLAGAALLLAGCHSQEEKEEKAEAQEEKAPVRVETIVATGQGVNNMAEFSGTLEESETSSISFSMAGTVTQFTPKEGEYVKKGQLIGKLDDSSLRSALDISLATQNQAQDAYDRLKILHDANSLPEIKWVDVQQKLIQAQSAVKIARNALDDATLYSPVSGMVAETFTDVGQVVAPGIPVVKIIDISSLKAVISVTQSQIGKFHEGDVASITFEDQPDVVYKGRLVDKGLSANPLSRTYNVKFLIENANRKFLPGMLCKVSVSGKELNNVIILPKSAVLLSEKNENFVWVDSAGTALKRVVSVGTMNEGGLEITSGLEPGDKVIVKGIQKVSNGTRIVSVNE